MCGIIGIAGNNDVAHLLVDGLTRVEYRGYDSCGLATLSELGIEILKDVGDVNEVARKWNLNSAQGQLGIAHTRWATHGGVSQENAHPHLSCDRSFALVHNGFISNHEKLKEELVNRGTHFFFSQTDTEVIAHLVEEAYRASGSVEEAFLDTLRRLEGTFGIVMISRHEPRKFFCARQKSPLILGINSISNFVGSDVNAFLPYTRQAVLLDDGEYAVVSSDGYLVRSISTREERYKPIMQIDWKTEAVSKQGHAHYMKKEIWEEPDVIDRAMSVPQCKISALARLLLDKQKNILTGVGTTYYMALFGQYALAAIAGQFAPAISSDEASMLLLEDPETLLLAISQSGETFDTLQALRRAKTGNARTAAIVNVPNSSMTREAELVISQNSGPEICVISTKAAMAQMALLLRIAVEVADLKHPGTGLQRLEILKALACLPSLLTIALQSNESQIREIARRYHTRGNWFFLGRGLYAPIAFESALKMKEVTYLHAEGMSAGFLKHGTLSLVDEETPCVFFIPPTEQKELYELTIRSVEEIRARKGKVIAVCFDEGHGKFDEEVRLPKTCAWAAPFLHLIAAQLLAYETAVALGRNVDRPRSLAKSVTLP